MALANTSVVLAGRQGYRLLDRFAQRGQVSAVLHVVASELRAEGHHAATDVDTDRGGNDRAQRRDDRTDRRALAEMAVGHERQVRVDERH